MTRGSSPARVRRLARCALFAVVAALGACRADAPAGREAASSARETARTEVIVLGMIHDGHVDSGSYGLDVVRGIVRAVDPDYVLAEIPPERLAAALDSYRRTGAVREDRVERFPEYTDAIIPLEGEMTFQIIGCAAWTKAMADDRRTKLAQWRRTRPDESSEVERAQADADAAIEREGLGDDPRGIHTERYDTLVRQGMEPYDRCFNDDLGAGGWTNINAAHYALIERVLDEHRGEGRRFLITFGAWHKYWFLEQLGKRDDVTLLPVEDFLPR